MSSVVLDSSAILALLFEEPGCEMVKEHVCGGLVCAVNHSEILMRPTDQGIPIETTTHFLARMEYEIVPFDKNLAAVAASLRPATKPYGLSLADRACLALGIDRGLRVLTADQAWKKAKLGVEVVLIR